MGTDALDAMLYAINPDGAPTPVASFGSCNVECSIVNEPAELEDPLNSLNDGSWSCDISSIIGIDLSRGPDFYNLNHMIAMKEAFLQYINDFIEYPIKVEDAVMNSCPNKRVSYLAAHARKKRTRKKNFSRAIRILQRNDIL